MRYLLHVGMPQSASTFLQDVFFPACADLNTIRPRDPVNRLEFYNPLASFEDAFWSDKQAASWLRGKSDSDRINVLAFERFSSTELLSRRQVAGRLADLCPGAKCLIIIRNQIDAIISAYAQRARVPNLFLPSFDHYFDANMRDPRASEFRRYFYDEIVSIYESLFGAESVLVVPYELLETDPSRFVSQICEFADIRLPDVELSCVRPNRRVSAIYLFARRAAQKFVSPETLRRIWLRIPVPARQAIKSLLVNSGSWDHRLTWAQVQQIGRIFGPSNQALSSRRHLRLIRYFDYPREVARTVPNSEQILLEPKSHSA